MLEINGKYNTAKVFTDEIDNATISQVTTLCNLEIYKNSTIRIMPDCCSGAGCVIGTVMSINGAVTPNLVGVDIGCGMLTIKLRESRVDLQKLDKVIREYVPSGGNVHNDESALDTDIESLRAVKNKAPIKLSLARKSIGTLGGGNHFIEIDKGADGSLYLVIHTGSRHLGLEVCNYYQNMAYTALKDKVNGGSKEYKKKLLLEDLKKTGRTKEISKRLAKFDREYVEKKPSIPYELAYCSDELLKDYLHDMRITQQFAEENRSCIASIILRKMKLHEIDRFDTIHNYIDLDNMILRKGSISAQADEIVLIPLNMKDGSLICKGKGNEDWLYSAPHGAGRLFSRSEAKALFTTSDYKRIMKESGVYTTSVCSGTLDECPMAYKSSESIISLISDTVDIIDHIKPIYNFKASGLE